MLTERSVDGSRGADDDRCFTWSDDISLAEEFLLNHKLAKIVVAIDTHSADNGYFVWTGSTADIYRACSLLEVTMFARISIQTLIPFPDTPGL